MKDFEEKEELLEEEENDVEETKEDSKPQKAKVSTYFNDTIKAYLDSYAKTDLNFAKAYSNQEKNINDCCNYILNQVQKSGCNGFADEEIFKMARDYYVDEIKPEDLKAIGGKVVVNHTVELTEEEKQMARVEALKRFENECLEEERKKRDAEIKAQQKAEEKAAKKEAERIRKEEEKKAQEAIKLAEAKAQGAGQQMSLFDMLEG